MTELPSNLRTFLRAPEIRVEEAEIGGRKFGRRIVPLTGGALYPFALLAKDDIGFVLRQAFVGRRRMVLFQLFPIIGQF
ncbi:MAG TPA: hypothetical protein VKT24_08315, partial [Rhizomicrobium sp.]|nr:hypothetical protein [Rhizomicrobium sp.]